MCLQPGSIQRNIYGDAQEKISFGGRTMYILTGAQ